MTAVALVGAGGIAQSVHLPILQRTRGLAELAAIVDLSPGRRTLLGVRYGVGEAARFDTVEALTAAVESGALDLDVAVMATSGLHCGDVATLLGAGLTVLCEKPLAYAESELDALEAFAADRGIRLDHRLRVGYMKEYDPAVAEARELLAGVSVRAITIEVLHPADQRQLDFARLLPPADDVPRAVLDAGAAAFAGVLAAAVGEADEPLRRLYASVLLGSVVHDIALLRHLGFDLAEVTSAGWWGDRSPGSLTATGVTGAGTVPWQLGWHFVADYPEYRETVTFHHEQGSIRLEFQTPYLLNAATRLVTEHASSRLGRVTSTSMWPQEEAFERELVAVLELAAGHGRPGSGAAEARADLHTAGRLYRAVAVGSAPAQTS